VNEEQIEHELALLKNQQIILVCPSFGTVSHSFVGELHMAMADHPILFHFQGMGIATIFHASDVKSIEKPTVVTVYHVIHLKGPNDYKEAWQHA
jgi:hypothetical protein